MAMLVGVLFVSIVFVFLLEVRKHLGVYSRNCLPLCTSCIWLFLVLPLGVGAPAAIVYLGDSTENFRYLSGIIISFISVVLMVGVSIGSIVLSYIFKQMELEQRAMYCVKYMKAQLTRIAVRSNEGLLRVMFDQYLLNGDQVLTETLLKKAFAFWWPVQETDPDILHNKVLIEADRFKALEEKAMRLGKKQNEIAVEKVESKKDEVKKDRRLCCYCCYEDDEESGSVRPADKRVNNPELIRPADPNAFENPVDFKYMLARLRQGGNLDDNGRIFGEVYVEPYNVVGIGSGTRFLWLPSECRKYGPVRPESERKCGARDGISAVRRSGGGPQCEHQENAGTAPEGRELSATILRPGVSGLRQRTGRRILLIGDMDDAGRLHRLLHALRGHRHVLAYRRADPGCDSGTGHTLLLDHRPAWTSCIILHSQSEDSK